MRSLISLFTAFIMLLGFGGNCVYAEEQEVDVLELRLDENIATPAVPKKAKQYVVATMDNLRRHLNKNGFNAKSMRQGEVLKIVIQASDRFSPCSVELKPSVKDKFRSLGVVTREPSNYKLIVAVHTDDTGDSVYADSISAARANAIDDILWEMAGEIDTNVIPYGIGKDEPIDKNTSRQGRAVNRRVEMYIVPDKGLLRLAGVKI